MPRHEPLSTEYRMSVIELEGRFYPVKTERERATGLPRLESFPHLTWNIEARWGIPPALGPQHTCGIISFRTHRQAIGFCHRRWEGEGLSWHWQEQAAQTEVYPERNVWYREALQHLCGQTPRLDVATRRAYASVFLRDGTYCWVWAVTVDEAWEQLYAQVERTLQEQQAASVSR